MSEPSPEGRLTRERMRRTGLTAEEAISVFKSGSIRREFPSQFYQVFWRRSKRKHDEAIVMPEPL